MEFALEEMTTSLVSTSYFSSGEEMEVDKQSLSANGTECSADDSDTDVIVCYRHVPITLQEDAVTLQMTIDRSNWVRITYRSFPGKP